MRKALPYRPIAALAALALFLSAFAPAPALPCAPAPEVPAPPQMPCHAMVGGHAMDHAPTGPQTPAPAEMFCCPTKAPLAPTPEQPAPVALVATGVLGLAVLPAPASVTPPAQATDASPPRPAPLHLLFGCFLT